MAMKQDDSVADMFLHPHDSFSHPLAALALLLPFSIVPPLLTLPSPQQLQPVHVIFHQFVTDIHATHSRKKRRSMC